MGVLSWLLTRLAGPLLLPISLLAVLTLGKIAWDKRDARILAQGEMVCDARWREAVRDQEQRWAEDKVNQARQMLESERRTNEGLKNEIGTIRTEMEALRRTAGADNKCLSDGVLKELRNRQRGSKAAKPAKAATAK